MCVRACVPVCECVCVCEMGRGGEGGGRRRLCGCEQMVIIGREHLFDQNISEQKMSAENIHFDQNMSE